MTTSDADIDETLRAEFEVIHRRISEERMRKRDGHAAEIFRAFGMDLDTPATRETYRRFSRAGNSTIDAMSAEQAEPSTPHGMSHELTHGERTPDGDPTCVSRHACRPRLQGEALSRARTNALVKNDTFEALHW